jgi:death-on-curing protein
MIDHVPWAFIDGSEVTALHVAEMTSRGVEVPPQVDGCVDRSIAAAVNAGLYSESEGQDLIIISAALLYYLAKNHCFGEGNKRAAWLSLLHQLRKNGLTIAATETEAGDFVNELSQVQSSEDGRAAAHDWLLIRVVASPQTQTSPAT